MSLIQESPQFGSFGAPLALLGEMILREPDEDRLLPQIAQVIHETLCIDHVSVLELREEHATVVAGAGWGPEVIGIQVSTEPGSLAAATMAVLGPVVIPDLASDPRVAETSGLRRYGITSSASVLVAGKEGPWGLLGAHSKTARVFAPEEVVFLQGAANLLALVMDRLTETSKRLSIYQRLEESEQHFRSLFEHHSDGVCAVSLDGRFTSVNHACEVISGYSKHELEGQPFEMVVFESDMPHVMQRFTDACAGTVAEWVTPIRHKSGRSIIVVVKNVPIVVGGDLVGVYAIVKDVTDHHRLEQERHHLEEQLIHSQRMDAAGKLAGGIAHDFNNMLFVIQANVEALRETLPSGMAHSELNDMSAACESAAQLVRHLLAFSRKDVARPEPVDVSITLERMRGILRQSLSPGIDLEIATGRDLPLIHCDRFKIEQVLLNLVINARDAISQTGSIRVSAHARDLDETQSIRLGIEPGRYIRLSVKDNGSGIPAAALDQIFDPFFTTKEADKGTGLGLSIAYGIVKEASGAISVASTEGVGTVFSVYLPVVSFDF